MRLLEEPIGVTFRYLTSMSTFEAKNIKGREVTLNDLTMISGRSSLYHAEERPRRTEGILS